MDKKYVVSDSYFLHKAQAYKMLHKYKRYDNEICEGSHNTRKQAEKDLQTWNSMFPVVMSLMIYGCIFYAKINWREQLPVVTQELPTTHTTARLWILKST